MAISHNGGALRSAAVISLCALFALFAMGLTLLSSGVYRSTAKAADEHFTQRTALSYLMNQVRRSDEAGAVGVGRFGDGDALILTERLDGYEYVTVLYCYEQTLMELYMEKGTGLTPADGVGIMPIDGLDIAVEDGKLSFQVQVGGGGPFASSITPRTGVSQGGSL